MKWVKIQRGEFGCIHPNNMVFNDMQLQVIGQYVQIMLQYLDGISWADSCGMNKVLT